MNDLKSTLDNSVALTKLDREKWVNLVQKFYMHCTDVLSPPYETLCASNRLENGLLCLPINAWGDGTHNL